MGEVSLHRSNLDSGMVMTWKHAAPLALSTQSSIVKYPGMNSFLARQRPPSTLGGNLPDSFKHLDRNDSVE